MSRNACNGENGGKLPASGDLNWMSKEAPWRLAILAKIGEIGGFGENRQRAGDNGDKRPDPLETGDFGENRQRVGNIQNVANIQIGCHLKLAPSN